jgi:hypothetical protein
VEFESQLPSSYYHRLLLYPSDEEIVDDYNNPDDYDPDYFEYDDSHYHSGTDFEIDDHEDTFGYEDS